MKDNLDYYPDEDLVSVDPETLETGAKVFLMLGLGSGFVTGIDRGVTVTVTFETLLDIRIPDEKRLSITYDWNSLHVFKTPLN